MKLRKDFEEMRERRNKTEEKLRITEKNRMRLLGLLKSSYGYVLQHAAEGNTKALLKDIEEVTGIGTEEVPTNGKD